MSYIVQVKNKETKEVLADYFCETYDLEYGEIDDRNFDPSIWELELIKDNEVQEESADVEDSAEEPGQE